MITYELVLKLKEAGFPFRKFDTLKDMHEADGDGFFDKEGGFKEPSLSELIEACGDITIKLWINGNGKKSAVQLAEQGLDNIVWYETLHETLAHLYLALNKK